MQPDISHALRAWDASEPVLLAETVTSRVFRVRLVDGRSAVVKALKPSGEKDELRSADYLAWRAGAGAVRLLARAGPTLLLEDAGDVTLLEELGERGDAWATAVLVDALDKLHAPSATPPPDTLQPLDVRFASLFDRAGADPRDDTLFSVGARIARSLLDAQRDVTPLHGDLHHANLMHASRGWLAIDPKGVIGDAAFDAANLFYNPLERDDLRLDPNRIRAMARAAAAVLDRPRRDVLNWAVAYGCLSASWHLDDDKRSKAGATLRVVDAVRRILVEAP